eukprot:scaffold6279_cov228-Isochrysis_galbana.AAC.1
MSVASTGYTMTDVGGGAPGASQAHGRRARVARTLGTGAHVNTCGALHRLYPGQLLLAGALWRYPSASRPFFLDLSRQPLGGSTGSGKAAELE